VFGIGVCGNGSMLTCCVNKKCRRTVFRLGVGVNFDTESERQLGVPLLAFFFFPNVGFLLQGMEVFKLHLNGCKVDTTFKET